MPEYETTSVGLSGPSCSGKTTLAREIVRISTQEITTLSFDGYWIDLILRLKPGELPDWESPESYNVAKFLRDLHALKREERIRLEHNALDSTSARLLLVEGFLLYYSPASRACFDRKFFIDLPEEEIIRRRLARSRNTFGIHNEREYIDKMLLPGLQRWVYPQRQYADLILDGLKPVNILAQEVLSFLG